MTARSLRADLPYRPQPDELEAVEGLTEPAAQAAAPTESALQPSDSLAETVTQTAAVASETPTQAAEALTESPPQPAALLESMPTTVPAVVPTTAAPQTVEAPTERDTQAAARLEPLPAAVPEAVLKAIPSTLLTETTGTPTGVELTIETETLPTTANSEPLLTPLTETTVYHDAAVLAQQLHALLVEHHGTVSEAVDNDILHLLGRYQALPPSLIEVEYYSNTGTFVREAVLEVPQGGDTSLLTAVKQIQQRQQDAQLPGLDQGMAWRGGFIRLARLGFRPVLLLPKQGAVDTGRRDGVRDRRSPADQGV